MPRQAVVYFVRMGSHVKIGTTTNLAGRMAQLCLPVRAVAATIPGGIAKEQAIHAQFADARIDSSEWFAVTPAMEEFLASIGAATPALHRKRPGPAAHAEVPVRMLHDVTETAILLDCAEDEVWRLIRENRLPLLRIGRSPRIRRADIDRLAG